ncbi:MAG: hypothetical protein EZS28_037523 [Streblomastix strix]|uniref:Uncharacterized protein n=1 Tax=Streblomastix strix TaxID=222440 RepID=A0A5J4U9R7_9EUKA|nr:MAG: hypothetical protein EZS28_037523 [Streblomastix strix]
MSITFCTAGGIGEEQDWEIFMVLNHFSDFLRELHKGRYYRQPFFQPLPLLARRTEEQMEEEGANEELEALMNNKGYYENIKQYANLAKTLSTIISYIYSQSIFFFLQVSTDFVQ